MARGESIQRVQWMFINMLYDVIKTVLGAYKVMAHKLSYLLGHVPKIPHPVDFELDAWVCRLYVQFHLYISVFDI